MDAIPYHAARTNLASVMNRACENHQSLLITRSDRQSVVLFSLEDYRSMEETAYLLRSPANVRRLFSAVEQLADGKRPARERGA